jgi:hypothetical protein
MRLGRLASRLNNLRPKSGHNRHIHLGRSPGKGDAVVMIWSEGSAAAVSRQERPEMGKAASAMDRVSAVSSRFAQLTDHLWSRKSLEAPRARTEPFNSSQSTWMMTRDQAIHAARGRRVALFLLAVAYGYTLARHYCETRKMS